MTENLFQSGNFILHSGSLSHWKIDCDALTNDDWATLALMISERVKFSVAIPIPCGGVKFASALRRYETGRIDRDPVLIVDDVLTTGTSMEEKRKYYPDSIGAVVFARGDCPDWITPLFQMNSETTRRSKANIPQYSNQEAKSDASDSPAT